MTAARVKARPGAVARTTRAEREDLVRTLRAAGHNDQDIARRTGLCDRTVLRIRGRLGLPAVPR